MSGIDKVFRRYGEDVFGKAYMNKITDEQVEEARVYACNELARRTAKYGKQDSGTVKDLFCSYIFKHF